MSERRDRNGYLTTEQLHIWTEMLQMEIGATYTMEMKVSRNLAHTQSFSHIPNVIVREISELGNVKA